MKIEVYTDGSATTGDKPGGWAYVIVTDDKKTGECCGHMSGASNNDAELEAAIQGLATVLKFVLRSREANAETSQVDFDVTLVSDSQLVLGWASGRYRFKQVDKLNKYEALKRLVKNLNVKTRWVAGHSGDEHNERCDKLANQARLSVNRKRDQDIAREAGDTLIGTKKLGTISIWYKDKLKVIDLESNLVENYDREKHGPRGGILEIREEKSR